MRGKGEERPRVTKRQTGQTKVDAWTERKKRKRKGGKEREGGNEGKREREGGNEGKREREERKGREWEGKKGKMK